MDPNLTANALFRLDLETGTPERLIDLDTPPSSFALTPDGVVISGEAATHAYDLDGNPRWTWPHPELVEEMRFEICDHPVVAGPVVHLACFQVEDAAPEPPIDEAGGRTAPPMDVFVATVDLGSGEPQWTWTKSAAEELLGPAPAGAGLGPDTASIAYLSQVSGVSRIGDLVLVPILEATGRGGFLETYVRAMDAGDGEQRWVLNSSQPVEHAEFAAGTGGSALVPIPVTGDPGRALVLLDRLYAVNPSQADLSGRPRVIWSAPVDEMDRSDVDTGTGQALHGEDLYITTAQTLQRMDLAQRTVTWRTTLQLNGTTYFGTNGLSVADGVVYTLAASAEGVSLIAWEPGTQEPRWVIETSDTLGGMDGTVGDNRVREAVLTYSISDGLLLTTGRDGKVRAYGTTSTSPIPQVEVSTRYPAPGEPVRVDLGASEDAAGSPVTAVARAPGPAGEVAWQQDPVMEVSFDRAGDQEARFLVQDAKGRTASHVVTFHVGQEAPSVLSRALAPQNQDATFFALGLVVTAVGALWGVVNVRRRRSILQRELAAIDRVYEETRNQPVQAARSLEERRARARGLVVDGVLDEGKFAVLETRIEELLERARRRGLVGALDDLPFGLVRLLEDALQDGRVTAWEREAFEAALAQATNLTEDQRARARRALDAWSRPADDG